MRIWRAAGVPIALTTHGLKDRSEFLKQLRKAVERGLTADAALAALTTTPAELFGVGGTLGSIEAGRMANLVVADGDLFDAKTKIIATWVEGREYKVKQPPVSDLAGEWLIKSKKQIGGEKQWRLTIEGEGAKAKAKLAPVNKEKPEASKPEPVGPKTSSEDASDGSAPDDKAWADKAPEPAPEPADDRDAEGDEEEDEDEEDDAEDDEEDDAEPADDAVTLKPFVLSGYQFSGVADGKKLGVEGKLAVAATISAGDTPTLIGSFVLPDGAQSPFTAVRVTEEESNADKGPSGSDEEEDAEEKSDGGSTDTKQEDKKEAGDDSQPLEVVVNYPLGAFGVTESPLEEDVAFVGVTVWTCAEAGVLDDATVVVRDGQIVSVGDGPAPDGVRVVDAAGMHLTPGIIDCHSHIATDGGINESGQAITSEVRIGDFIDPDDITIYRQLAGGVTTANVLHGSANPIGGQNQVIKLRWGADGEAMKFAEAPLGIKFALGENVKQSNWGERFQSRYPQSRMGVDELMIDAFRAAQGYRGEWRRWERTGRGLPPRRDLELEALVEILEHKRWVHCHSYRQSEILALLRTLEGFGVQIGTLQHILEGYKLAPEIAAHGAMASSFADWWAYKFEVFDAIPYNGAMLHEAGVVVSFNSDDHELGRHLNQEAAKAVKYGGVPPEEALKFVTLNAARQLRIDHLVGSVEAGKQADLVLWSGPPLSNFARCEQTWIDGRQYFSRAADKSLRERDAELKTRLIQLVLDSGEAPAGPGEEKVDPSSLWPRCDIFCSGYDCR